MATRSSASWKPGRALACERLWSSALRCCEGSVVASQAIGADCPAAVVAAAGTGAFATAGCGCKQLGDHKSFDVSASCLSARSSSLQPAWPHLPLPKLRLDSNNRVHEGSEGRLLALAERVGCSAAGLCSQRCSCGLLRMSRHSSSKRCLPILDSPLLRYQPVRVATIPLSLCHV